MQNETFLERTQLMWFLGWPEIVGLIAFGSGFLPSLHEYKDGLLTIGGTIFGSSLGTVFGLVTGAGLQRKVNEVHENLERLVDTHRIESSQLQNQILRTLSKAVVFPWTNSEEAIEKHRKIVHMYHRTREDNDEFWIYSIIDFSEIKITGRVCCTQVIENNNRDYKYESEAFLIGARLLIITTAEHSELPALHIFSDFGSKLRSRQGYWGVELHQDWNSEDGLDPCLIFENPLDGTGPPGRQNQDFSEKLMQKWRALCHPVGIERRARNA